ncbi:MAG: hypothetical protein Q7T01_03135 [bacterium]|nr:hypothetical protein [bacterium]
MDATPAVRLRDLWLVLEGDDGGQVYLTCPLSLIPGVELITPEECDRRFDAAEPTHALYAYTGESDYLVAVLPLNAGQLHKELDRYAWPTNEGKGCSARVDDATHGNTVSGGMGGGKLLHNALWLHREFVGTASHYRDKERPQPGAWRARAMELLGIPPKK